MTTSVCGRSGLGLLVLVGVLSGGCARGVKWDGPTYQDARAHATERGRLTLVYFRSWCSVECTDFEEQVLKDAEVLAELDKLVCVPLELRWDASLAERWGLERVPSYVILDSDEHVLARGQAPITRAELLAAIREAKPAPATSAPATTP